MLNCMLSIAIWGPGVFLNCSRVLSELLSKHQLFHTQNVPSRSETSSPAHRFLKHMLAKLEKEPEEDAEEKAYCDEEMKKTEAKKAELEEDLAKVTSKLEQAAANSAKLKEEVKEAQKQLADQTARRSRKGAG